MTMLSGLCGLKTNSSPAGGSAKTIGLEILDAYRHPLPIALASQWVALALKLLKKS